MSYAALVVYVDDEPDNEARIALGCELARVWDAHLIGVSGCEEVAPLSDAYGAGILMGEVVAVRQERAESELAAAETRFHALAKTMDVVAEWRADVGPPTPVALRHARSADMLIVGRDAGTASPWRAPNAADLVMRAGRPVLIVPPNPVRPPVGSAAVVAWTDSREARLAVQAALPLLRAASKVTVVEIAEPDGAEAARLHVADVAAWLLRHGVKAEGVAKVQDDRSTGRRLLDCVGETEAGLLVSGAWGHSRMREWIFGGVTQTLLTESPVALLLAH